jgi:hypothetical protein
MTRLKGDGGKKVKKRAKEGYVANQHGNREQLEETRELNGTCNLGPPASNKSPLQPQTGTETVCDPNTSRKRYSYL